MLPTINKAICIFSAICLILAAISILFFRTAGTALALVFLPKLSVGGVGVSAILWILAQYHKDDRAIRFATIALSCFAACTLLWFFQLFSNLQVLV